MFLGRRIVITSLLFLCAIFHQVSGQVTPKWENGHWGVVDGQGAWIAEPIYESIYRYSKYLWACEKSDDKLCFVHSDGRVTREYELRAGVRHSYREPAFFDFETVVNDSGLQVLPAVNAGKGYLTFNGEYLKTDFKIFSVHTKWYGKQYFKVPKYSSLDSAIGQSKEGFELVELSGSLYSFRTKNRYGIVRGDGSFLAPPIYQQLHYVPQSSPSGRVQVHTHLSKKKFVDASALFPFKRDGLWGYMNQKGKEVIPPRFVAAYHFNNGLAAACKQGRFGYIDTDGKWAIEPRFKIAFDFNGEVAPYLESGFYGLINREGKVVLEPCFKNIEARLWYFKAYGGPVTHNMLSCDGKILDSTQYSHIEVADSTVILEKKDTLELWPKGYAQRKVVRKGMEAVDEINNFKLYDASKMKGVFSKEGADWSFKGPYEKVTIAATEAIGFEPISGGEEFFEINWYYKDLRRLEFNWLLAITILNGKRYLHYGSSGDSMEVPAWLAQMLPSEDWVFRSSRKMALVLGEDLIELDFALGTYKYTKGMGFKEAIWNDTFRYETKSGWGLQAKSHGVLLPAVYQQIEFAGYYRQKHPFAFVQDYEGLWAIYDIRRNAFITPFTYSRIWFEQYQTYFSAYVKEQYYRIDFEGDHISY